MTNGRIVIINIGIAIKRSNQARGNHVNVLLLDIKMYGKVSGTIEKREDIFFQCGKLIFFIVFYLIFFYCYFTNARRL